jgi:2-beta-glucuronyltransferase
LRASLPGADLVIVESGPPIVLADLVSRYAPHAALVYRVSDDVDLLGLPPFVRQAEVRHAHLFDRISMASPILARKFPTHETVAIDPIGIPKKLYDTDLPNPYEPNRASYEAVCAGTTQFDIAAVLAIARLRPGWRLHILGRLRGDPPPDCPENLIFHHEQPFEVTAGYVRHADIGLAPYLDRPGVEYQTHQSNRILQYRYFGLPIIGPQRLCHSSVPSIYGYSDMSDQTLESTLTKAEMHKRVCSEPLPDWHDLYLSIVSTRKRPGRGCQNAKIEPPP